MIRWDPVQVIEKCDEADRILAQALPIIERAAGVLQQLGQVDGLPQYITQPVNNARASVKDCGRRAKDDIQSVRAHVPKKELERWRYKGRATTLGIEVTKTTKPYTYVPRGMLPRQDTTRQTSLAGR